MTRTKLALAAFLAGAFATVGLGQNADKNSAGPTRNDYRIKMVQPAEGSTVTGSTVQVVVNTEIPADRGEEKRDVNSMPRPTVDVFLDDTLKGTMRDAENVLDIESVSPGTHTIVLLAKNQANEIIDRKEVHFSSINGEGIATKTGPADTTSVSAPAPAAAPAPMSHEPTAYRATSPTTSEPARAAATSTYSSTPENSSANASSSRRLPATASSDPALALVGAGLLLAAIGLHLVSRRRRAA